MLCLFIGILFQYSCNLLTSMQSNFSTGQEVSPNLTLKSKRSILWRNYIKGLQGKHARLPPSPPLLLPLPLPLPLPPPHQKREYCRNYLNCVIKSLNHKVTFSFGNKISKVWLQLNYSNIIMITRLWSQQNRNVAKNATNIWYSCPCSTLDDFPVKGSFAGLYELVIQ